MSDEEERGMFLNDSEEACVFDILYPCSIKIDCYKKETSNKYSILNSYILIPERVELFISNINSNRLPYHIPSYSTIPSLQ
jgi:hypothetical protein